jgi:D-aminopeptidase
MQEKKDLIVTRTYQKAGQTVMVLVRKITGGDISGAEYQFETWPNAREDVSVRVTSGDKYFVRNAYQAKLREMQEENWSKAGSSRSNFGDETRFFDPDSL